MSSEFKRLHSVLPESASLAAPRHGWLWTSVPPLLLLALGLGTDFKQPQMRHFDARAAAVPSLNPAQNPPVSASLLASLRNGVLPVSQTLVVSTRNMASLVSLRGEIQGADTVRGRAPMSGAVSRVLVRTGQTVNVGDAVMEISATHSTRRSSRAQAKQNSAESAQVAAVGHQEALQRRMLAAQTQLQQAQERVAAASARLAAARLVVQKLTRGETVSRREAIVQAPRPRPQSSPPSVSPPSVSPRVSASLLAARDASLRSAEKAQRAAERAAARTAEAARAVTKAEDIAKSALKKVNEMRVAADGVQKQFDAGAAKASDVDAARAALEDAQNDLNTAPANLSALRQEAARAQADAESAKANAQAASGRAAQTLQKLQVFASDGGQSTPENKGDSAPGDFAPSDSAPDATGGADSSLSVGEAASLVRNAIAESDEAAVQARRLKARVDAYQQQVQETRQRLDSSGKNLENAQQRVLDETIQHNLSSVRAPASGTVRAIAEMAQEVSSGDAIIEIGRSGGWQVQLSDSSDAWRALKPGTDLQAVAQSPDGQWKGTPLLVRVREIEAPRKTEGAAPRGAGAAATIFASVLPAPGGRAPRAGMAIRCSLIEPGSRRAIVVPSSAVTATRAGTATVAVLMPSNADETETVQVPDENLQGERRIEWRTVKLGAGNGVQQEIVSGLQSGERIALQPAALRAYVADSSAVRLAANL